MEEAAPAQMLTPADRVVMISGASRGIGLAIARRLAGEGYRLSLGVRAPARFDAAGFDPERILVHRFDALEAESAADWVAATAARFGRIDALINNAGILRAIDFETGDEAVLDEVWAVNVKAPFRLIRHALPHLAEAGNGRIINIASTDGKRYRPGVSIGYTMSKHAVMALTQAAKFAGWERGVRATALCPGAVDTDLIAGIPGVTPRQDRIAPETLAETVSFLLRLPNSSSVAELVMNTRLETWI
ncbi:SDR family NAD(P)-dependent oxidoreductase [Sandarakinorhabdus limnophila]|uniref:SDR family NAD(P)-dependent oxidoreductase n=1 Tax=Sandarakinorhabdus limnophila TaxID=210512 RepID=UPI0026ED93D7|nr:SDR family NAD(P)-dependent oxidoreductase [Sandarakinorhabdus limnophila]MCM0034037.1 SDR family NAD(P)-dependent oxidoreductase [Sandarakinorhabdus limnophila]